MMLSIPAYLFAQTNELKLDTGEEIYKAACIGCHGPNGKGQPETTLGFEKPPEASAVPGFFRLQRNDARESF